MDADGSNVRALKAPFDTAYDVAWSPDASHVVYTAKEFGPLIVMRSDGSQRAAVVKKDATDFSWSPDGTLLAYELYDDNAVHFVRSDGTRAGSLALPPSTGFEGWVGNDRVSLITSGDKWVADRVGGGNRVDLPDVVDDYAWSPSGSRLAYWSKSRDAFCLSNAHGLEIRCPESSKRWTGIGSIAWSSAGDRVAVVALGPGVTGLWSLDAATMRAGEAMHWKGEGYPDNLVWSSDTKQIALTAGTGAASDIWVVHADGSGLRRLTSPGFDGDPHWVPASRLARFEGAKVAPVGPAFLVSARAVEVHGTVDELAADGVEAAVLTSNTPDQYQHVVIWKPGAKKLRHIVGEGWETWSGLALAGDVAAWMGEGGGNYIEQSLEASSPNVDLSSTQWDVASHDQDGAGTYVGSLVGDGGLIAWNEWSQQSDPGPAADASLTAWYQGRQRLVLRGPDSFRVVAADGTHLLVLKPDGSLVVAGLDGKVVRRFAARQGVRGASLNANDVVVIAGGKLIDLDLATGKVKRTWNVPPTAKSVDVQDGVASYAAGRTITLVDLRSGKKTDLPLKTTRPPLAQLEPAGLFHAYGTGGKSWVRLLPFTDIRKRLGSRASS